ncbi:hypothetical protein Cni_G25409 [Canna indica]|uniref:Uncharacterized protein n=1 Tax=Canna indica TaxID=4628 RepID=A0AAQ3QPE7_9LILI|nr:hypothetical protein Cni_G25409 [Canna indica]
MPGHDIISRRSDDGSRPLSPLGIKQDGKFYSRLLSKDDDSDSYSSSSTLSSAAPSFRVYYSVAPRSVPFLWESHPGTPKVVAAAAQLPPLTPPPSFFCRKASVAKKKRKRSRFGFLIATLLRRLRLKRRKQPGVRRSPGPPVSPVSSSLISSPFSRLGSWNSRQLGSSFSSRGEDELEDQSSVEDGNLTRSVLCFRVQRVPRTCLFLRQRREHKKQLARLRDGKGSR